MRRHKSDRAIAVLILTLLIVGLIMIYMIGPMRANVLNATYGTDYSDNYFFLRQLLSVGLALAVLVFTFKVPYRLVQVLGKWIFFAGIALCIILMILAPTGSDLVSCQLGACRWFKLPAGLSLQPSEVVKLGLVLWLAGFLSKSREKRSWEPAKRTEPESLKETFWRWWRSSIVHFWLPFGGMCGAALFLVVIVQKDLGTGASMMAIILAMLFMSGIKMRYFIIVLVTILAVGVLSIVTSPHRMERILTFSSEDSSDAYHIENAMIAIGAGGLWGVGPGNSVQATGYLPESINDSVFAVIGETFGFVGLVALVMCFAVLLMKLLKVANFLQDTEQSLIVIGVFAWATAHVVINIAAMTALMPLTGITLPFLSYGGTSMLFMSAAFGLVLQLSCYTSREPRKEILPERLDERRGCREEFGRRRQ